MARTPFVVLTITRSGSTWLNSLLDRQPNIAAYNELFLDRLGWRTPEWIIADSPLPFVERKAALGRLRPLQITRYLDEVAAFSPDKKAYGFKLMLHPANLDILALLAQRRYRLISLVRDNIFEGAVSRLLLSLPSNGTDRRRVPLDERVRLDPKALVRQMKRRQRGLQGLHLVAKFWPWRSLLISYEALRTDEQRTLQTLLEFLDVDGIAASTESPMVKQIQKPYDEIIDNCSEVVEQIEMSGLGRHLPPAFRH